MLSNRFKQLWEKRTGKPWQPARQPAVCIHILDTGKPYIPARPCRGNKIICLDPQCPAYKCELPINHCKPSTCKYFTPASAGLAPVELSIQQSPSAAQQNEPAPKIKGKITNG